MSDGPLDVVVGGMVMVIMLGIAASIYVGNADIAVAATEFAVALGIPLVILAVFGTVFYQLVTA